MKKKFSIWLNIVTICLCMCAIAIGVYAATNATLTVSGQVGFEAHGCELTIEGTLSGYATSDNATSVIDGTKLTTVNLTKTNTEDAMALGNIYFSDLTSSSTIPQITLKLDITNTSKFAVTGTVSVPTLTTQQNMTITASDTSIELGADETETCSGTITLTFTVANPDANVPTIDLETLSDLKIVFEKQTGYKVTITYEPEVAHGGMINPTFICLKNGIEEITIQRSDGKVTETFVLSSVKTIQFKSVQHNRIDITSSPNVFSGSIDYYNTTQTKVITLTSDVVFSVIPAAMGGGN